MYDQSINQDISNTPANKISRWRARQTMDIIKQKTKCEKVQLILEGIKFGKKEGFQFVPKTTN